jgi:hypothetical protein
VLTRTSLVVSFVALAIAAGWWTHSRSAPKAAAPSARAKANESVPAVELAALPTLPKAAAPGSDLRARVAQSKQLSDAERARAIAILDEERQARQRLLERVRDAELPRQRASETATLARNAALAKIKALLGDARFQELAASPADSDSRP